MRVKLAEETCLPREKHLRAQSSTRACDAVSLLQSSSATTPGYADAADLHDIPRALL